MSKKATINYGEFKEGEFLIEVSELQEGPQFRGDSDPALLAILQNDMRTVGQVQPILINKEKRIEDGNRRLQALKKMGVDKAKVAYAPPKSIAPNLLRGVLKRPSVADIPYTISRQCNDKKVTAIVFADSPANAVQDLFSLTRSLGEQISTEDNTTFKVGDKEYTVKALADLL